MPDPRNKQAREFTLRDKQVLPDHIYISEALKAFSRGMGSMNISLPPESQALVEDWLRFYTGWEGRRVVGFDDPAELAVKLLVDSFAIAYLGGIVSHEKAMDLGSGNGWPGLAVRLLDPCAQVYLVDSRQGACDFLQGYIGSSGLSGVRVIQDRAEDLGHNPVHREKYTLVTTRAMAGPPIALELCSGLLAVGGKAVLWISSEQEVPESGQGLKKAGLSLIAKHTYTLPDGMGTRILALYSKVAPIGRKYPRRYGAIRKNPLH
jgi:16S rRNA (guanine527-N7)-methyltransferase